MKIVDSERMTSIDKKSQTDFGIPSMVLMEDAGLKSYIFVKEQIWKGRPPNGSCLFVAGKGNNGGDALVIARHAFFDRIACSVLLASETGSADMQCNLTVVKKLGIPIFLWDEDPERAKKLIQDADWVFDGISGTGIRGPLLAPLVDIVACINASKAFTIAIDVPSGVGDGFEKTFPAVRAALTLTMGLPKLCLFLPAARRLCGTIQVIDVGFPPGLTQDPAIPGSMLEPTDLCGLLPEIPADAHKGSRGHCAVFAGSVGSVGAAFLAASACGRSGCGLVSLFAEQTVYAPLAASLHSVMVKQWNPEHPPAEFDLSRFSALLVGPGWGIDEYRASWLKSFIASHLPGIIDADGIRVLKRLTEKGDIDLKRKWILTPHPGEFAFLAGAQKDEILKQPLPHLCAMAKKLNAIIVLKGHVTYIGEPDGSYWIYDGMNPALGTGGSGDVLAGIACALLALGMDPSRAARTAVLVHGLCGKRCFEKIGFFLAEDMLPEISAIVAGYRCEAEQQ